MRKITGELVISQNYGKDTQFFIRNANDAVQNFHSRGIFYEEKDLQLIARYFPKNGHYVDIGTNVGNHTIFVTKFLHPASVVVFEPSQEAIDILEVNLKLNNIYHFVDTSNLGYGIGDTETVLRFKRGTENNLGASKFTSDTAGVEIIVKRADSLLDNRQVDFIKIDVEGFELKVLAGLEQTIKNYRPLMYIEVDDRNSVLFRDWVRNNQYVILERIRHYSVNENFLLAPSERLPVVPLSRIGIGIVTYNRIETLKATLAAVFAHTKSPFYLVVADDGSSDGTQAYLDEQNIHYITGKNKGIAWNKNRALFSLLKNEDIDTLILLEDDTFPIKDGWEQDWVEAAARYGYVTHAHSKVHDSILCGSGTPSDAFGCTKITSQCSAVTRTVFNEIGFFDTRFFGYGIEDGEWTTRFRNAGYGLVRFSSPETPDRNPIKTNAMIHGGVTTADVKTFRDNESVERNRELFQKIRNDPVPRPAWRDDTERQTLVAESNQAAKRRPQRPYLP